MVIQFQLEFIENFKRQNLLYRIQTVKFFFIIWHVIYKLDIYPQTVPRKYDRAISTSTVFIYLFNPASVYIHTWTFQLLYQTSHTFNQNFENKYKEIICSEYTGEFATGYTFLLTIRENLGYSFKRNCLSLESIAEVILVIQEIEKNI